MLNQLPIRIKVFIAPAIIIALMLCVMLVSELALRRQQAAFLQVVGGSLTTSVETTKLLLAVADIQSEMLRYTQLQQRLPSGDQILIDLRRSIVSKYQAIDSLFEQVKSTSMKSESDAVSNISDFLTIHRAVSLKILEGEATGSMTVSTLLAHYQQLQSYIVELASRSLESAQVTESETEKYIDRFSYVLYAGSAAIIAISILLTFYIGRAISGPLTNMIKVMNSIANGNSAVSVPGMERRDEIGAMAKAVDVFATVSKELHKRELSLIEARAMAESASQHKSQFLANMSHELRTPLNAILGYTELMSDNIYGDISGKMREVVDRIQRNGKHLLGLINDVLDLSKIEAGQLTLSFADYSLKEMVQSVFTAIEPLASEKGLTLKIELPADLPRGHGDERRLTQVLLNLVGNAIKFTDKGEVVIRASAAEGSFAIAVRDTGHGVAEGDQTKIFEQFQQADNTATRKKGGTGLGLSISKRIIEMHGGRIWVESRLRQGSTFYFTLPVNVEQQVASS
jgi:signal transduction histidine kinase